MNFNRHSNLAGKHALLSASKYSWLRYSEEKLDSYFRSFYAAQRGSELHALAADCIRLGVNLPDTHNTLNMHVNDAIQFGMKPEVVLYFSDNCFGTADAIGFDKNVLRIHDLKTGATKPSMDQLDIYTALFCLEYGIDPQDIRVENRIYYQDDVIVHEPDADEIMFVIDKIITFDQRLNMLKQEE